MEVEAKFVVPDIKTARALAQVTELGGFRLSAAQTLGIRDTFFDTANRDLSRVHYVLRVRKRSDGKILITLKTPAVREGAIFRRPEIEKVLDLAQTPRRLNADALPAAIRTVVERVVGSSELRPLFSISQTRKIRVVRDQRQSIGEWSLDHVEFRSAAARKRFYELEVELKHEGTTAQLEKISKELLETWKLEAQTRGKFQRAYEFMESVK